MIALLVRFLEMSPLATIRPHAKVVAVEGGGSALVLADGERIGFGHCVIAAGPGAFPLIDGLVPDRAAASGRTRERAGGVGGRRRGRGLPVLFQDGLYIVPHDNGTVAIGSTSEDAFDDPFGTDGQLDDLCRGPLRWRPRWPVHPSWSAGRACGPGRSGGSRWWVGLGTPRRFGARRGVQGQFRAGASPGGGRHR